MFKCLNVFKEGPPSAGTMKTFEIILFRVSCIAVHWCNTSICSLCGEMTITKIQTPMLRSSIWATNKLYWYHGNVSAWNLEGT